MHRAVRAAVVLALAAPVAVRAGPIGSIAPLLAAPYDQTEPSIAAEWVVYADDGAGDWDVKRLDVLTGDIITVAGGPGDQDQPASYLSVVAWRDPAGISAWEQTTRTLLRAGQEPGAEHPRVSSELVAWEQPDAGGTHDIGVWAFGTLAGRAVGYAAPGDQHGPAPFRRFVAFVDDGDGGAVRILDAADGSVRRLCPTCTARAFSVVGTSAGDPLNPDAAVWVVAQAGTAGRSHVVVYADDGSVIRALDDTTEQVNPHVSGDWVAYEEIQSDGSHQIRAFDWRTGEAVLPPPSPASETLNDVSALPDLLRVVFVVDGQGLDLWQYQVALPLPGGPPPPPPPAPPPPATCADASPTVLSELRVARDTAAPQRAYVDFTATKAVPVLVCVDVDRVSSAWVGLDDVAIVRPSDLDANVTHLEVHGKVDGGPGRLAAVVAGKPGASLHVRVLADPGRTGDVANGVASSAATRAAAVASGGCASGGGATWWAGLGLLLAGAFRRRRARA